MKLALLFPGQGSQQVAMGKGLYENFACAKEVFDEADQILSKKLSSLIFEGSFEELTLTKNAQLAILTVSTAALRVLEQEIGEQYLKHVSYVAGHSLGEYNAIVAAKVMDFAQALKLVRFRSIAMQEAVAVGKGAMAAIIGLQKEDIETVIYEASIAGTCDVANDNADGQIVVSGAKEAVLEAMKSAKAKGARKSVMLNVSAPFHCRLMMPAQERMYEKLENIKFNDAQIPVISNYLAKPITKKNQIAENLVKQISGKVRWRETMLLMKKQKCTFYLEVGNGKVLSAIAKRNHRDAIIADFSKPEQLDDIKKNFEQNIENNNVA